MNHRAAYGNVGQSIPQGSAGGREEKGPAVLSEKGITPWFNRRAIGKG